jgi:hypothetical protein
MVSISFCTVLRDVRLASSITHNTTRTRRRLETLSLLLHFTILYEESDRAIKRLIIAPARSIVIFRFKAQPNATQRPGNPSLSQAWPEQYMYR